VGGSRKEIGGKTVQNSYRHQMRGGGKGGKGQMTFLASNRRGINPGKWLVKKKEGDRSGELGEEMDSTLKREAENFLKV